MKLTYNIILAILAVAVVLTLWRVLRTADEAPDYVFTEVVRTDLRATVSSTGTLEALETVDVGTQVSGQVAAVYVDYNDRVEAGQLLALLDTESLDASLADARARVVQMQAQQAQAQAGLTQAQATRADAQATLERNAPLAERGYLSQSEFQPLQTAVQTAEAAVGSAHAAVRSAEAQVSQAQAQVVEAQKNRTNAEIRAPISGLVVERSVDAGQTVAASLSTPTLFVLAENLDQMQVLADVDESDIGQIHSGQAVTFTVPAYPEEAYEGTVRTVRLQPTTESNVVTYTVVVEAVNVDGQLLPGMTATVDFVTGAADDVLAVSTAALQVRPTPEMLEAAAPERPRGDTSFRPVANAVADSAGTPPAPPDDAAVLWYVDGDDLLHVVPVRMGLQAGALTEITLLDDASTVGPGLRVVEQVVSSDDAAEPTGGFGGPGSGARPPRM